MEREEPKLKFWVRPHSLGAPKQSGNKSTGSPICGPPPRGTSIQLLDLGKVTSSLASQVSLPQKKRPGNQVGPLQPVSCFPARTPLIIISLGPTSLPLPTHHSQAPEGHQKAQLLSRWRVFSTTGRVVTLSHQRKPKLAMV